MKSTRNMQKRLSKNPDVKLLRLKAELPETRSGFKGLSIFDTPGFNAIVCEHAEVLKEFLPESDVVVFPVSYKVGFGSSDQQLMELIGDVRKRLGTFPVILVVNRAPASASENDNRVREIRLHAEDTLHEKIELVIVHSSQPTEDGESTLPSTDHLWHRVAKIVNAEERMEELNQRLKYAVRSLLDQRIQEIDSEIASATADDDAISELVKIRNDFREKENAAYKVVDKYMQRLSHELPRHVRLGAEKLVSRMKSEIGDSNKWTDANSCQVFIYNHVLPFGTTEVVHEIEEYLFEVFEQMDEELSEMANLTIRKLNDRAQTITKPSLKTMVNNLGLRIGQRVAGATANYAVKGVSGVGGVANGVGNLVKMGVKQAGKLVGKTFSREVYTTIGKVFTKRAVQAMSAALQVVIEAGIIIWDANRWQGQLIEKSCETVET